MKTKTTARYIQVYLLFVLIMTGAAFYSAQSVKNTMEIKNIDRLTNLLTNALATVTYFEKQAQEGKLPLAVAQQHAMDVLQSYNYAPDEYIWATNAQMTFVAAPLDPQIIGQEFAAVVGQQALSAVKSELQGKSGQVVHYIWSTTRGDVTTDVQSIAVKSQDWGWYLGSGVQNRKVEQAFYAILIENLSIALFACLFVGVGMLIALKRYQQIVGHEPSEILSILEQLSRGDLNRSFELNGKETGIYKGVLETGGALKHMVAEIKQVTVELNNSCAQMAQSTETVSGNTAVQADKLSQAATAMSQIMTSVEEVAEKANSTSGNTQDVEANTQTCAATMSHVNEQMGLLTVNLAENQQQLDHLQTQANRISSLVEEIRAISEQTNLLALNAAIEAARAGEVGRGFAVVADEVRALADRTQKSTVEIDNLVSSLRNDTQLSVKMLQANNDNISQIHQQNSQSLNDVNSVFSTLGNINHDCEQIAVVTEEQFAATVSMNTIIENLLVTAESTNQEMASANAVRHDLLLKANGLSEIVAGFKI